MTNDPFSRTANSEEDVVAHARAVILLSVIHVDTIERLLGLSLVDALDLKEQAQLDSWVIRRAMERNQ